MELQELKEAVAKELGWDYWNQILVVGSSDDANNAATLLANKYADIKVKEISSKVHVSGRSELLAFLKWFGKEYASSEVAVIGEEELIDEYEKSK